MALIAVVLIFDIGSCSSRYRLAQPAVTTVPHGTHVTGSVFTHHPTYFSRKIALAIGALMVLMFSKFFYLASLTFYYTFYLIGRIHSSVPKFTRAVS